MGPQTQLDTPASLEAFHGRDGAPTQAAIADRLGLSRTFYSEIVRGRKTPSLKNALNIERVTGVRAASLLAVKAEQEVQRETRDSAA